MNRLAAFLTSLKLTVGCFGCSMVLLVIGTLAQVEGGTVYAQRVYFRSFFLYWTPPHWSIAIPIFPGGALLGALLTVNLVATFSTRSLKRHPALMLLHIGVFTLLLSEVSTGFLAEESQMPLTVGEAKNYSESRDQVELAIIDHSATDFDEVVAIPEAAMMVGKAVSVPSLPFSVTTVRWQPNAKVQLGEESHQEGPWRATKGFGQRLVVEEQDLVIRDDQVNTPAALLELRTDERLLGTWLVSSALAQEQRFRYDGKEYGITLRHKRHYFPFSLRLLEFRREMHPGTDIPKSYSSLVRLYDEAGDPEREMLISMNHPLRYGGKTFYQASYGEGDTLSIFQVVDNPGRLLPYIATGLVACGLVFHFGWALYRRRET